MWQWQSWLEEANREVRQLGVAVPGGVEHVGLRARTLHETSNLLNITDCSNAFITVNATSVFAKAANGMPVLTLVVAKCYDTRPAEVFFRVDSDETRTIACTIVIQQGGK